jgi:ApaG protein
MSEAIALKEPINGMRRTLTSQQQIDMIWLFLLILLATPASLRSFRLGVPPQFVVSSVRLGGSLSLQCSNFQEDITMSESKRLKLLLNAMQPTRKELWADISRLEESAVKLLRNDSEANQEEAMKLLAKSAALKNSDPFIYFSLQYENVENDVAERERLLQALKIIGVPPHLIAISKKRMQRQKQLNETKVVTEKIVIEDMGEVEEVDPGSTFSETVTEGIRVKVSSFFDAESTIPTDNKYMFWYKVAIYNEGIEPVQVVARMWEIEKCVGEKEVVRGAGIMHAQPIIQPGDFYSYQSSCPLNLLRPPPRGKRILGSMSGAYTMCKGNMGQHNFTVRVSKFNLIMPEPAPPS